MNVLGNLLWNNPYNFNNPQNFKNRGKHMKFSFRRFFTGYAGISSKIQESISRHFSQFLKTQVLYYR